MTDSDKKYELASPEFVDAFRDFMTKKLADTNKDGVEFNYSWVATDPPAHLRREGQDAIGWSWSIHGGKVTVNDTPFPPEENDFWLKTDYENLRQWIKLTDEEDAVFMANEMQKHIESGALELHYDNPAQIEVIGKFIRAADWRDSFFSLHVA